MIAQYEDEIVTLIQLARGHRVHLSNEAETRLLLIDQVLTKILGWPGGHLNPEQPAPIDGNNAWLDYHLTAAEHAKVVVEAKKAGATFDFSTQKRRRKYRLRTLMVGKGRRLTNAINQAIEYCRATGTPTFAVTNGIQWIISVAWYPYVGIDRIDAVVFHDLADIRENLEVFFDLLSPSGVRIGSIFKQCLDSASRAPTFASSVNAGLSRNDPAEDKKNYLVRPLDSLMRTCFDALTDTDRSEMLKHCYVTNELSEGYVARLESFVGQTLPHDLVGATKLSRDRKKRPALEQTRDRGEALLLVGSVGTGKSTFLQYALGTLRQKMAEKPWILLDIDFIHRTQSGNRSRVVQVDGGEARNWSILLHDFVRLSIR